MFSRNKLYQNLLPKYTNNLVFFDFVYLVRSESQLSWILENLLCGLSRTQRLLTKFTQTDDVTFSCVHNTIEIVISVLRKLLQNAVFCKEKGKQSFRWDVKTKRDPRNFCFSDISYRNLTNLTDLAVSKLASVEWLVLTSVTSIVTFVMTSIFAVLVD